MLRIVCIGKENSTFPIAMTSGLDSGHVDRFKSVINVFF